MHVRFDRSVRAGEKRNVRLPAELPTTGEVDTCAKCCLRNSTRLEGHDVTHDFDLASQRTRRSVAPRCWETCRSFQRLSARSPDYTTNAAISQGHAMGLIQAFPAVGINITVCRLPRLTRVEQCERPSGRRLRRAVDFDSTSSRTDSIFMSLDTSNNTEALGRQKGLVRKLGQGKKKTHESGTESLRTPDH